MHLEYLKEDYKENIWTHKRRRQLENKNEQGYKNILQGADIVKFLKSSRIRCYGHVERMQNQIMPKQIAAATMEGKMKRGRPRKNGRTRLMRA
jgi:hypothetical protein